MKKKKIFRLLIPLILISILIGVVAVLSSGWLDKRIKTRLINEFNEQSNGRYSLEINRLRLNLLTMSVKFSGVTVKPDSVPEKDAVYTISTSSLDLNGVGVLKFLINKKLNVNKVHLTDPSIKIIRGVAGAEALSDTARQFSLYGFVRSFAKSVTLNDIEVDNFDMIFYNSQDDENPSLRSNENSFRVKNFHIGQSTEKLPGYFEADSILLTMNKFTYTQPDSLYTFTVGKLTASFNDSLMAVDSISLKPNYSKKRFGNVVGKQTDRFNIGAKSVVFNKIDLRRFLEHHNFIAKSADITRFNLHAHRDKNDIREYNRPPSFQKILKDLPVYIKIDSVILKDSYIEYEEVAKGNTEPGKLTFNRINGNFTGLTNDSLMMAVGSELTLSVSCHFMNEARLNAKYKIPLNTELMKFKCTGYLTDFSMTTLNKVLEPLAGISLKEGIIDTLDFSFDAGEDVATGTMKFIYHDLKLSLSNKGPGAIGAGDRIKMFIADNFVIKNNNPEKNKPPRISKMYFKRDKQRFMFNYTWKTIFSGIRETIGIPENSKL